jgi:formate hydrogenlyase subunit 3/multisubunit Na+/H+ antiporter MnhD subunit
MFMAAGSIYSALGHDRIADLAGVARALPISTFAFGLGGISLVGLPPAGGFLAKWWLLSAAVEGAQWWWALVLLAGGLLTATYLFAVLSRALRAPAAPLPLREPVARSREMATLALALASVLLGLVALLDLRSLAGA